jgi:hypothetical protein
MILYKKKRFNSKHNFLEEKKTHLKFFNPAMCSVDTERICISRKKVYTHKNKNLDLNLFQTKKNTTLIKILNIA